MEQVANLPTEMRCMIYKRLSLLEKTLITDAYPSLETDFNWTTLFKRVYSSEVGSLIRNQYPYMRVKERIQMIEKVMYVLVNSRVLCEGFPFEGGIAHQLDDDGVCFTLDRETMISRSQVTNSIIKMLIGNKRDDVRGYIDLFSLIRMSRSEQETRSLVKKVASILYDDIKIKRESYSYVGGDGFLKYKTATIIVRHE